MKKISIGITIFFIALSAGVILIARTYPPGVSGAMGPGFFPMILAGIIIFISIFLLKNTIEQKDKDQTPSSLKINVTVLLSLVILVFYIFVIGVIGFPIATLLFLFGLLKFFKVNGYIFPVAVSACTTVILYCVFTMFLSVQLPRGIFF